eukprot:15334399-Ditylum_brightwellii.AAC.2
MDAALFNQHMKHFSQAQGTSHTVLPISTFGKYAESETGQAYQDGTLNLDNFNLDPYILTFLKELQHTPEDPPLINTNISTEDVKRNYKYWKEARCTSPTGRYLSLYKTWLEVPKEKQEDYEGIISEYFFAILATIMQICKQHQIPVPRWLNVHNLYILKKARVYKIHHLCTLHKLESEVNLMQQEVIAQRLMQNTKKHHQLDEDQHGGRNGRTATGIMVGKSFTMDTVHFQRANIGCTDCDTKACYGWIAPLILLLMYIKIRLAYPTGIFFATILYNMQYYITTAFGTATQSKFFEKLAALYDIGQGSTDGPSGWTMLSDVLLNCYNKLCKGFTMANPANNIKLKCNADMFVNENTLMHNDPQQDTTPYTLMTNIQHDAETWSRLL